MSRRSFFAAIGVVFLLGLSVVVLLFALIRYEPQQYVRPPMPAEPAARQRSSQEFTKRILNLINAINNPSEWSEQFTDEQVNSYLDDEFIRQGIDRRVLPDGITQPRVVFDTDTIRLVFRYGTGHWSTIISIDMRVWVPPCDTNVVLLELQGFRAGALPISAQSLLERVAEGGRLNAVDVAWYRHNGHPVALLRFGTDQPRTTVVLESLQVQPGSLSIKVRAAESSSTRAQLLRGDFSTLYAGNWRD